MQEILRTERETRKFRLLVLLLVAIGLRVEQDQGDFLPGITVIVVYLVYLSLFHFAMLRRVAVRWLPYLMLTIDVAFAAGTLYVFGVDSPAFVLMPVLVVYYALYFGYVGSLLSASMVSLVYVGLAFVQGADLTLGRMLPVQIPLFYLLALFSGVATQQRKRAQRVGDELAVLLQAERGARAALQATASLSLVLDTSTLSRDLAELVATASDCDLVGVRLIDRSSGALGPVIGAFVKDGKLGDDVNRRWPDKPSTTELSAFEQGQVLEVNGKLQGDWPMLYPGYIVVVPLVVGEDVIGTLLLLDRAIDRRLTAAERQLVDSLARSFGRLIKASLVFITAQQETSRMSGELRGAVEQIARRRRLKHNADLRIGKLLLEPGRQNAHIGVKQLQLSSREFGILYALAQHHGQPVSHEVLLREVWDDQRPTRSNVVDVAINRLRRKLAEQASASDAVQTLRGRGYVLDPQCTALNNDESDYGKADHMRRQRDERGSLILEHVISLAIVAIVVPALLAALSTVIINAFEYDDRTQLLGLAQSQMENVKKQSFQASPATYSQISLPQDYAISVVTSEAQSYVYANGTVAPEVLQAITVTVTGYNGSLGAASYRYRE